MGGVVPRRRHRSDVLKARGGADDREHEARRQGDGMAVHLNGEPAQPGHGIDTGCFTR